MSTRSIAASLAMALLVAMPTFVQAVGDGADGSMPSRIEIERAAAKEGALDPLLSKAIGDDPTEKQLGALYELLSALAASNPALAAQAAQAVAAATMALATDNPQAALSLADIPECRSPQQGSGRPITSLADLVIQIVSDPAVSQASPQIVADTLATLNGAVALAQSAAENKDLRIPCWAQTQEALDLAIAQSNLAGFTVAAGGDTAGIPSATAGGGLGGSDFSSFTSGSGGGGGTPTATDPDASTTTL